MSNDKHQFIESGFMLLENQLNVSDIDLLENEYNKLLKRAIDIIQYVDKENLPLSDFYKLNQHELVVVPEQSNRLEVCRFEYISACSKAINDVLIQKTKMLIDDLLEDAFVLFKDKCNIKNPGGGAFPPHQDISAYSEFTPRYYVTAAIMLDDSNVENGCLEMATEYRNTINETIDLIGYKFGKFPLFEFYKGGKNNGDIKENISRKFSWKAIEAKKGDVLLFDSFIPHRSKENTSRNKRRIFFFTFNSESEGNFYEEYYHLKKNDFNNPMFHVSTPTQHDMRWNSPLR